MRTRIHVTESLSRDLLRMQAQATTALENAAQEGAEPVKDRAKSLAPHRTGQLEGEITIETEMRKPTYAQVGIGSDLHYTGFVEMGTSKMQAQPFLRPALFSMSDIGAQKAWRAFKRELGLA